MKKLLILSFLCSLSLANDGFFIGFGGGMTKAQFEAKNYTNKNDLSQRYEINDTYNNIGFDIIGGYKSFINNSLAYRVYGEFNYYSLGKVNAPEQSTAKGINKIDLRNFDVNADFIIKPFKWLGFYAGGFVGYSSTSNIAHQEIMNIKKFSLGGEDFGADYGVNFGVDFSFGNYNQHSIEAFGKINFSTLKGTSEKEWGLLEGQLAAKVPDIEAKLKPFTTIGLRYVYYFISKDYKNKVDTKKAQERAIQQAFHNACPNFEKKDLQYVKDNINYTDKELENGIVRVEGKTFYCTKIKVVSRSSETKSFAVNNSKIYDFNAKITKETIKAQKVKNGKVIENNVNIVRYKIEPVEVISYGGLLYKENAPQLEIIRKRFRDKYIDARREVLSNEVVCASPNGNIRYCDGDLVKISGVPIMIRVDSVGIGRVRYSLYYYTDDRPVAEANYSYYSNFTMTRPEVYGNHNLDSIKEEKLPDSYSLSIDEVATFQEW